MIDVCQVKMVQVLSHVNLLTKNIVKYRSAQHQDVLETKSRSCA